MFTERIPGFIKINESGVLFYFGFNGRTGEHQVFAGAFMPEQHFIRKFDQVQEMRGRLVFSNLMEEGVNFGYVEDRFDLLKDDDNNLNCIYKTTYGYVRVIEVDEKFLCENWGKAPWPQVYLGDGISAVDKETIYLFSGTEIVREFRGLGNGIFHNYLSFLRLKNPQKTLLENIEAQVVH